MPGNVSITNTTFINAYGNYGGAVVLLGGDLNMENTSFISNRALYGASALFTSLTIGNITNTTFISNEMIGEWVDEGALYLDAGEFNITNSYIANNGIKAIHARDTILNVSNTIFDNNTQAIYGVFSEFELNNITLGNDTLFLNGTDYQTIMQGPGTPYTLINNTINVETLPSRFDSRDWVG